ncbi:MAG: hypothetical protein ACREMQ_15575, partial [Longimicrobiales bacterium]
AGLIPLLGLAAALSHFGPNTFELRHKWSSTRAISVAALFLLSLAAIYSGRQSPFLYFQF